MFSGRLFVAVNRVLPYTEVGLESYVRDLPSKTIELDGHRYMTRWKLSGRLNGEGDGSEMSEYIHCIWREDYDRALHNHPWAWAFARVLVGGYVEEQLCGVRDVSAGDWNVLTSNTFHRVARLHRSPTWTYFIAGPRTGKWGFLCDDGSYRPADEE